MADTDGKERKLYLKVPGQTVFLELIRKAIIDLGTKMGFPNDELAKVEMAVDEACANIMVHAYTEEKDVRLIKDDSDSPEGMLEFEVNINNQRLIVELKDQGKYFQFDEKGNIDLDAYFAKMEPGGLGIYVIKTFMDEVSYVHKEGEGNILKMVKYFSV